MSRPYRLALMFRLYRVAGKTLSCAAWNANTLDVIGALEGRYIPSDPERKTSQARPVTVTLPALTRRKMLAGSCVLAAIASAWGGWRTWWHSPSTLTPEAARLYQQGLDDIHAGAYFAATKALEQAVKVAPAFSPARARLAESWFELDLPERAAREFLPIRRRDNSSLPALDQLQIEAVDLTITREFEAAAAKYEQMLRQSGSGSTDLSVDLGRSYERAGKPDKAITAYRRAAEGASHSPAAWLRLLSRGGDPGLEPEAHGRGREHAHTHDRRDDRHAHAPRQAGDQRRRGRVLEGRLEGRLVAPDAHQAVRASTASSVNVLIR